ncbi:hypothetical protein ACIHDR_11485 [Nocardia sp. NPDC052278]|uniref:hypothetical protein n=1 Tax=unclassified Nocardia TaxID=2637762 RepID=UPI0036A977CA
MSGSTLGPGESLSPGQSLQNGDYTLTYYPDGELVLSSTTGGVLQTWEPKLNSCITADGAQLRVGSAGELYLVKDGQQIGTLTDPFPDVCNTDTGLSLQSDGTVAVTTDGRTIGIYLPKANGPIEFPLYHPRGETEGLKDVIDTGEAAIDAMVDPMRGGHPEKAPDVMKILVTAGLFDSKDHSVLTDTYTQHLNDIVAARATLENHDQTVTADTSTIPGYIAKALGDVKNTVDDLNDKLKAASVNIHASGASGPYTDTYTSDNKIPTAVVNKLLGAVETTIEKVQGRVRSVADEMKKIAQGVGASSAGYPQGTAGANNGNGNFTGSGGATADNNINNDTAGSEDYSGLNGDLLGTDGNPSSIENSVPPEGDGSDIASKIDDAINDIKSGAISSNTAGSGASSGSNPLESMIPMMMSSMMSNLLNPNRQQQNDRTEDQSHQPTRSDSQLAEHTIPATAPASPDTPSATAAATASPPPVYAPGSMVDMKLPDGSVQRVSSTVAEAVNKELNNPNGCDARAAYAGTPGQAPWNALDNNYEHLQTGDVVQWTHRSGLLVVGSGGQLDVIINGQLHPLDLRNLPDDGHGDFGQFQGFFHPGGADLDSSGRPVALEPRKALTSTSPAPSAVTTTSLSPYGGG